MKIKFIIITLQLQCSFTLLNAQSANLSATINNTKDSSEIWFCRSIDGKPINYCGMYDKAIVHNGGFNKSIDVADVSIVTIVSDKYLPKISIICEKNDSVRLRIVQNRNETYDVQFDGNNAEGQIFFYQSPVFHNYLLTPILAAITDEMQKKDLSFTLTINRLDSIKQKLFSIADTLYLTKKISAPFYKIIKLQSDMQFLSSLESCIQNSLGKLSLNAKPSYLTKVESLMTQLQKFYYEKYDPFSLVYNDVEQNLRLINCKNKCRLVASGIFLGKKNDIGLWERSSEKSYSFAPIELQHRMMAINLSFNCFYNRAGKQNLEDIADFQLFKTKFPNSPYIPTLNKYFKKEIIFLQKNLSEK